MSIVLDEKKQETNLENSKGTNPERIYLPSVDVFETEKEIQFAVEIPGVAEDSIDITIDKGILSIEARRTYQVQEKFKKGLNENAVYVYSRKFQIGKPVDVEQTFAKLENGVLKVHLFKMESTKKKVEILSQKS
jgi:HSP20 family protein